MRKGFYKILIVVMSIALIGLIIIQFYWLNLTLKPEQIILVMAYIKP